RSPYRSLHHGTVRMTNTMQNPQQTSQQPSQRHFLPADGEATYTTGPKRAAAIAARNFSFWYGDKQALFNIDVEAPKHAITALIGPSGCGKSTFLRSINRMNDLTPGARHTGTILLEEDDIFAPTMDVVQLRQRVGMVFQRWNP